MVEVPDLLHVEAIHGIETESVTEIETVVRSLLLFEETMTDQNGQDVAMIDQVSIVTDHLTLEEMYVKDQHLQ